MKLLFLTIFLFLSYLSFAQSTNTGCNPGDETLGVFINANGETVYHCKKPQGTKYYKTYIIDSGGSGAGEAGGNGGCDPKAMCLPSGKEDTSGEYGGETCINMADPRAYSGPVRWVRVCN